MWPFKKEKPKVHQVGKMWLFDPDEIEFVPSPEYDKAYKKGMDALDAINRGDTVLRDVTPPKPDTIESLINRLIELGEPKPEVVITGKKFADGGELHKVDIDGLMVERATLAECEWIAICVLKRRIAGVPVETTTITY